MLTSNDLKAGDVLIKENGKEWEVTEVTKDDVVLEYAMRFTYKELLEWGFIKKRMAPLPKHGWVDIPKGYNIPRY